MCNSKIEQTRNIEMQREDLAYSLSKELGIAVEAALLGGEVIRDSYNRTLTIAEKNFADFCCEADQGADKIIQQYLRRMTPEIDIVSEESNTVLTANRRTWIIDPLDGTSAFIFKTGKDQPSILIALLEENHAVGLGVAYFPLTDELFMAAKGKGAFFNLNKTSNTVNTAAWGRGHVIMNQYQHSTYETKFFADLSCLLRQPGGPGLVTIEAPYSGSACRILDPNSSVIAVIHDNSETKPKQCLWDIAAIKCILEEAGGLCVNEIGEPYDLLGPARPIIYAKDQGTLAQISNQFIYLEDLIFLGGDYGRA